MELAFSKKIEMSKPREGEREVQEESEQVGHGLWSKAVQALAR